MQESNIWQAILNSIEQNIEPELFKTWFKPLTLVEMRGDQIVIGVPNIFYIRYLNNGYTDLIEKILREEFASQAKVSYVNVGKSIKKTEVKQPDNPPDVLTQPSVQSNNVGVQYTFENFVSCNSNNFAYLAATAVSKGNLHNYNPLFIYGGVGLGKTHLLHAIGNRLSVNFPKLVIRYVNSETFVNECVDAMRVSLDISGFRKKYRDVDVLLFDDVQFLHNKPKNIEEFFNTFNDLYENRKLIVITSDRSPRELDFEDRLRTRFASGVLAEIDSPSIEERVAIIMKKSEELKYIINEALAFFLAENIATPSVRELLGALRTLGLKSELYHQPMSIELAKKELKSLLISKKVSVSPQDIINTVATTYSVKISDLTSKKRSQNIVLPRKVAMYILKDKLDMSLTEIGNHFGGRDHSTVKHSIESVKSMIETDDFLLSMIKKITLKTFG